jgi:hypothetical protein
MRVIVGTCACLMMDLPPIESSDEAPARATRGQATRWKPGQSGNPQGMRIGTRHKRTLLLEGILGEKGAELLAKVVELGLAGDAACLKICLDRLLPPKKSMPIRFKLPALNSIADAQSALALITAGMAAGKILSDEAVALSGIVTSFVKTIEASELESRLTALEQATIAERPGAQYNA